LSCAIISRVTAAVDIRSSHNASGMSRNAKRLRANCRTDWVRGVSPPPRLSGRPMTRPATSCRSIKASSAAMSSAKRRRRIVSSGLAMTSRVSESASPTVLVPTSSPMIRRPGGTAARSCWGSARSILDHSASGRPGDCRIGGFGPFVRPRHPTERANGVGQGRGGAYRRAGADPADGGGARTARRRIVANPDLGRATRGGRYRRCRADDERRGDAPADARGSGDGRRAPRRDPAERAAIRRGIFRRAQGGRVSRLTDLNIAEARTGLAAKQFSARELAEAYIAAMERARPLNAYITETPDMALDMAAASDARIAKGEARPLDGIPIAVKDLFCTKGVLTTAASHILDGFHPPYESTVTDKLWQAGAVMLGKTNLDEFAMGSSTTTSWYRPTENPWRPEHQDRPGDNRPLVPGGSSGGSAAAIASHAALGATGTDTGGSIRQPASFCGIVGLKPTYGRCSLWGVVAYASSLDHPGSIARIVRDTAIMLGAMAGHDPKDSTSAPLPVRDFETALTGHIRGLKIGIPKEYRADGMPAEIEALWQQRSEEHTS